MFDPNGWWGAVLAWWQEVTGVELVWLIIGLGAQSLFMMRFLIQWIVTERARKSIVPEAFWYFSIAGGISLLAYAVHRADPVIIIGQLTGITIYARNLYFIWREKLDGKSDEVAKAHEPITEGPTDPVPRL